MMNRVLRATRTWSIRSTSPTLVSNTTRRPAAVTSRPFFDSVTSRRHYASSESAALGRAVRTIQDKFVEAKDEYETALESQGTTYAVEDNETARELAAELQTVYDEIMRGQDLSEAEKQTVKEKLSARIRELTSERTKKSPNKRHGLERVLT